MKGLLIIVFLIIYFSANSQTFVEPQEKSKWSVGGSVGISENFSDVPSKQFWESLSQNPSMGFIARYKLYEKSLNKNWTNKANLRFNFNYSTHINKNTSVTDELSRLGVSKVESKSILFAPILEYNLEKKWKVSSRKFTFHLSPYVYAGIPIVFTNPTTYKGKLVSKTNPTVENKLLVNLQGGFGLKVLHFNSFELSIEEGFRQSLVKNISGVIYSNNIAARKDFFYSGNIVLTLNLHKTQKNILIDTDNDGVPDRDDRCPTQAFRTKSGCKE